MSATPKPTATVDLRPHAEGLRACLGASLIRWNHADVACMDFLRKGRARSEWDALWSPLRDGSFRWDHVGRAQMTPKAQEFLLVRAYPDADEFTRTRGLPFRREGNGYRQLIATGRDMMGDGPLTRWTDTSPDYALRLSIAAWRLHSKMCGRVLLAFRCSEATSRSDWDELLAQIHKQYGLSDDHAVSRRIFRFFYEGSATTSAA